MWYIILLFMEVKPVIPGTQLCSVAVLGILIKDGWNIIKASASEYVAQFAIGACASGTVMAAGRSTEVSFEDAPQQPQSNATYDTAGK